MKTTLLSNFQYLVYFIVYKFVIFLKSNKQFNKMDISNTNSNTSFAASKPAYVESEYKQRYSKRNNKYCAEKNNYETIETNNCFHFYKVILDTQIATSTPIKSKIKKYFRKHALIKINC